MQQQRQIGNLKFAPQAFLMSKSSESQKNMYLWKIYSLLIHVRKAKHQWRTCDGYFPNSLRPISYLGYTDKLSDKEWLDSEKAGNSEPLTVYVLGLKTKVGD